MGDPAAPPVTRKRRVGFVNSHPIQYFVPLYRRINETSDLEAVPIYLTDHSLRGDYDPGFKQKLIWDVDLLEGTDPVFVAGAGQRKLDPGPLKMMALEIVDAVHRANIDMLVIHGHNFGANHLATLSAKLQGIPVVSRGETHLGLPFSQRRLALRQAVMKRYYSMLDGFLVIGSLNREFYRSLGVPDEKLFDFPYTVDNERMIAAATLDEVEKREVRAKYGVRLGVPAILYASKFMPRKHPDDVIKSARRLREEGLDFDVVMVGAGEMDAELRTLAKDVPGAPVIFPGFVNQQELPRLYGAFDIFTLPSEAEPWGLIVNEAMCGSMPIVASEEIGSVADLVKDDQNGRLHKAGDVGALTAIFRDLVSDEEKRKVMGARSLERIREWNYDRCVEGLRMAVERLTAGRKRS